jgi:hypothetical protein
VTQNSSSACSVGLSILLNVVGGFITVWIAWAYWKAHQRFRRRKFKAIFGTSDKPYALCYGSLILNPQIAGWIPEEQKILRKYPLMKRTNRSYFFSAESSVSSCEVRAASYLASALGRDGAISSEFRSDEALSDKLDIDFISFGGLSNTKTVDVFSNEANDLAFYDEQQKSFVFKKDSTLLGTPPDGVDYGIILKIHPQQFNGRTWIVCAGYGEWGTSGAAYFLAEKRKEISVQVKGDGQFVCLIRVKTGQDESATLIKTYQTS